MERIHNSIKIWNNLRRNDTNVRGKDEDNDLEG